MREIIEPTQVSINFSCLQSNEISADMYVLLFCKHYDNTVLPEIIKKSTLDDSLVLDYLESKDFIKVTGDKVFSLRQKAINLFEVDSPTQKWLEFLGKFPLKVPSRNGGTRALKVANPDSKGNVNIKKKYLSLIKSSPSIHETIIKVLNAEVKMRRKSNDLQYMNNMETWLNQACYDKYAYLIEEEEKRDYKNEDWK